MSEQPEFDEHMAEARADVADAIAFEREGLDAFDEDVEEWWQ